MGRVKRMILAAWRMITHPPITVEELPPNEHHNDYPMAPTDNQLRWAQMERDALIRSARSLNVDIDLERIARQ